jgi:hypothetical protein
MDGISLQRRVHDENAGVVGGAGLNNKPGLGAAGGSSLKPGPLSARKAFGNITNKAQDAGGGGGAGGGGATVKRRALGELSGNRPASQPPAAPAAKPSARQPFGAAPAPAAQQRAAAAAAPAAQQPLDLAQRYALGGVERPAGKTWRELEEEREAADEAAAAAAAQRLTARLGSWRLGPVPLAVRAAVEGGAERGMRSRRCARSRLGRRHSTNKTLSHAH